MATTLIEITVTAGCVASLTALCLYGLHRYFLVYLHHKHAAGEPRLTACFRELPRITVQLPMYNERYVAARVIESACRIDYPQDRLQIQVLDDSTDDTVAIAREAVGRMRERGFDIEYRHREQRIGYKAGALEDGLEYATGEFIAIFDADFVPEPQILKDTIHYFSNPHVGMVQTRWDHLNRGDSLLTRTQAVLLDGHFVLEHGGRCRSGRFMSFNGTAGLWRKSCIVEGGGWEHDTLTEDLDLSYRSQLVGWKFLYLNDVACPAELPPEVEGFKSQQHRWSKGGAQTCRKLLPRLLAAKLPFHVKLEAIFHLTSCTVSVFMVLLVLMMYPALWLRFGPRPESSASINWLLEAGLFMVATCSAGTFYSRSQRELGRSWAESLKYLPFLMSLGVGISINNTRAVLSGLFGRKGEFVRTPKFGLDGQAPSKWVGLANYRIPRTFRVQPFLELAMGLYMVVCLILSISLGDIRIGVPFMALFAVGFLYVAYHSLFQPQPTGGQPAAVSGNEPITA